MIKLLATTILSLSILGGGATAVPIQRTEVETQNEIQIQTKGENDGLYNEEIAKLYEKSSNEPKLGMDYFYAPHYFSNLEYNFGNNYFGTCGYVATGMLLSFWDTYWDDNIIPEQFDNIANLEYNKLSYGLESPGIYRENEILNGITINDYYEVVENYSDTYFQLLLIKMVKEEFNSFELDSASITGLYWNDYIDLYNYYIYNYRGYSTSDVDFIGYGGIGSGAKKSENVRNYAINLVKKGIPVKLGIGHNYDSYDGTHAVVAYDYNEAKDELYCHFGWGPNTTHVTIESLGYTSYNNVFGFNFKNGHNHSNNYKYNTATHCACHYVIPYHIDLINGNYRDVLPIYKWNGLNQEKWFAEQNLKYKFSILDQNRHAIFTTLTSVDEYQLTQEQRNEIFELENGKYYAYVVPYSDVYPYWDDYGYSELFAVLPDFKYAHVIKSADYGYVKDVYPTDADTKNNYTAHNVNGFSFETKRYRTGYIQSEYIVLSPIRKNINEAFIEYKFDIPVLRIDVQLTHWRNYSSEKLSSQNGSFVLEAYNDEDVCTEKYDLLSKSFNLPTNRKSPNWYTFEFSQPVKRFKFHSTSSLNYENEDNKGRICIGDLAVWTQLPMSGYELEYNTSVWEGLPSLHNNCYAYALNNQIDIRNNEIWHKQQPGELSGMPNYPFTKDILVAAVEKDFEKYNELNGTNLIFKEVGRFENCPKGTYKVALVSYDFDYHWYRQNADGTWSHKPGTTPVKNCDNSNEIILDPQFCDRGKYENFLGYFAVTPWGNMYDT